MMEFDTGTKDRDYVVSLLDGVKTTLVVKSACELDVFDELLEKPLSSDVLAERKGWHADGTERLLNALVSIKLLSKKLVTDNKYEYSVTGAGRQLARSEPHSAWSYSQKMLPRYMDMFTGLVPEIKKGAHQEVSFPAHVTVHKTAQDDPKHPDHKEQQDERHHGHGHSHGHHGPSHGHHGHGHEHGHGHGHGHGMSSEALQTLYRTWDDMTAIYAPKLLTVFDWSCHKSAVDLGGGSGVLSFELARKYPDMAVTLFEVPPVVELVKQHFLPGKESLNVSMVAGDFTTDTLPAADLYLLCKVVHDWGPDQVDTLLAKVFASVNPGGGIVLSEQCLNDEKDGPATGHMWDLMVFTHCAGRLRTRQEYTDLLNKHGFRDVKIAVSQPECQNDVIYARKP